MSSRPFLSRGRAALTATLIAALTALSVASARATITPDAQKVIDKYLEASGGRTAWERSRTLHASGSIRAFGLTGKLDTWRAAPDKRYSEIQIGPLDLKDWVNGGKAWRIDPSGKLLALDGKDLEQAMASTWFDNERWLEPDQGGGTITGLGEVKDSLGTRAVLEVTPPNGGKPRRFEFDRKTGLIVRDTFKMDQASGSSTYSDWRRVDGWLTAFRTVQEVQGAPANTAIAQMDTVVTGVAIPAGRFDPPANAMGAAITWLKSPGVAHLPFEYRARHVWLKASVNGGPLEDFIYDTGASVTVIDSAYAAKIGLKSAGQMQAQGAGSAGGASFATLDRLRIQGADGDGVELANSKVAVLSVNPALAPFFWKDCAGIIGFDAIVQFVNEVDFDGRTLTLYDPKTFTYAGKGTELPMTLAGTVPVVNVKVDGQYEGAARLDIGSGSTLDLHTPFVKKYDLIGKHPKALTVMGGGFGGTFESRFARMKSLEIGPYKVDEPLIGLSTIDVGALASEDYAGNLGNRLLERFKVTLDYDRRKIWLEPGARYGDREGFSRFGAQIVKRDDRMVVGQLLAKSPAAEAGLHEGDEVVSIDGATAPSLDPDRLEERFEKGKAGEKVALVVRRDGKEKKLTVKLKDLL